MRREIYFFAALFLLGIIVACGDDEGGSLEEEIVGTWTEVLFVIENCNDTNENDRREITCDTLDCTKLTFTDSTVIELFLQDGRETSDTSSYVIASSTISIIEGDDLGSAVRTFTANITNNRLTLSPPNEDGCEVRQQYSRD